MHTLIVDDNPLILESMKKLLLRVDPEGSHTLAASAASAMAHIRQKPPDVVFLDIEMPGGSGLDMASQLRSTRPETNVVIITGHSEYAMQALQLYVSGYLLKPITEEQIRTALANLRHPVLTLEPPRLTIRCFGEFGVWIRGVPVKFGRSKSQMLLAYLVDRNGAMCTTRQLQNIFWPEEPDNASHRSQLRMFLSDLQTTLTRLGVGEALVRLPGQVGINKSLVECDYYDYLRGIPEAVRQFRGEYMRQYDFGEETLSLLMETRSPPRPAPRKKGEMKR